MSMKFSDLQTASKMRDLIEDIATKVVEKKRPEPRIGTVDHVDQERQLAWVKYPGEDVLVKVRIARNMLPTATIRDDGFDAADVVRVAGKPGSYYVVSFIKGDPADPKRDKIIEDVNNLDEDFRDFEDQVDSRLGEVLQDIDDVLSDMNSQQEFLQTRNATFRQATPPVGTPGAPLRINDIWYKTDEGMKVHIYTQQGWVVATGSHLISPNGRLTINPNGMFAQDQNGNYTMFLDAGTGALILSGTVNVGLEINSAIVTGSTVQTSWLANRGVKMSDTGLAAYHPVTGQPVLQFLNSTGSLAILGDIRAGSTITGATYLAVDQNNQVTFHVDGNTGFVEMKGNIKSGSTISGANIVARDANNNIVFSVHGTNGTMVMRSRASGTRFEINNDGFFGFNSQNQAVMGFNATGAGSAWFTGSVTGSDIIGNLIRTAATGTRVEINGDGFICYGPGDVPTMGFSTWLGTAFFNGTLSADQIVTGRLRTNLLEVNGAGQTLINNTTFINGQLIAQGMSGSAVSLVSTKDAWIQGELVAFSLATFQNHVNVTNSLRANNLYAISQANITGGASARIADDGRIIAAVSSQRFKNVLGPIDTDISSILALDSVFYTEKTDISGRVRPGVIAEQAHDLGLTQWVIYGNDGTPFSFDYEGFTAALLVVARNLDERITSLEGAMAA